jgi:3-oxoacyl-[acyl-carrier protein] reductase
MDLLVKDKICLVTGASRGIGKAIAMLLAQEGGYVYAVAQTTEMMQEWISQYGMADKIVPVGMDISEPALQKELIMRIRKEKGRLDVLVNNAAIERNERIGMITRQSMQRMFEVNVFAPVELIQLATRLMLRDGGSIINIASKVALRGNAGQMVYSATKGALVSLTKSAAKELATKKIRVNAIAPGLTNTRMFTDVDPELLKSRVQNICMGRLAEPEDIANAALFLASDLSGYISGQVLGVDGCTIL